MSDEAILLARLIMGLPWVIWGTIKLRGGEAKLMSALTALHLPGARFLAFLVGLCELIGGLGVILGYPIVTFCLLLGLWCLVTGTIVHKGDSNQLLAHITMSGGFLALAVAGAGSLALFGGHPQGLWAMLP